MKDQTRDFFSQETILQKKKDTLLLQGCYRDRPCLIKAVNPDREDLVRALEDEYAVMSGISHPRLPVYYRYQPEYPLPRNQTWPAIIMEYIPGETLSERLSLTSLREFLDILYQTGTLLKDLLAWGVLYTDLNPGNIIMREGNPVLVDFTGAWFFRHNPNPSYSLRFSYQLSPDLPGEQLLVQELALMLNMFLTLPDREGIDTKKEDRNLSSSVYVLLETGLHPSKDLTLDDYTHMIRNLL